MGSTIFGGRNCVWLIIILVILFFFGVFDRDCC